MKKIICLLLAVIICLTNIPFVYAQETSNYKNGDVIEFGSYPQTLVEDKIIIEKLNEMAEKWTYYDYFSDYTQNNYMKFTDVKYNNDKYRGVLIEQYRPTTTRSTGSAGNSYQDDNGYNVDTIYWFKWEPIKWIVLDVKSNLIVSDIIIDSQPYCNYLIYCNFGWYENELGKYASDYATSNIRRFLNEDFYNSAFNNYEKYNIKLSENLKNSDSTDYHITTHTDDNVFLLSYEDIILLKNANAWNFAKASDYANSQGFEGSSWHLRNPYVHCGNYIVHQDVNNYLHLVDNGNHAGVNDTYNGIRPALRLKTLSKIYFVVSSDIYSVDSIHRKETATYKINLLDENSDFLPIDDVIVQNNTTDIVAISTKKVSDTELELTVEPIKDGDASLSLFNGNDSAAQYFNFTVYSNTTTYRADQVPVTDEKLKTNFSRGDLTVDNFEYKFDENKGKYIATMDVYNSSGAIGVVAAYTQDGLISEIEQVDPYIPLPSDFGEFLVYLGTGAVGILKGENWNYRFAGDSQKTPIEIEVPEDGYLTVSCDVTSDNAAFIYNLVSIGVDFVFKTAEIIDVLGTDTDKLAKDTTKTLAKKVSEYFNEDSEWTKGAIKKLAKKLSKQFNMAYLEEISVLSLEMLDEMYKNVGEDFSDVVLDVIIDLTKEEIKEFGVMAAAKKLVKDKVIGTAEKTLLKAASIMFDGGSYINLLNSILGAYRYNVGTGKTMVVFKPKGEDGFICKDTIKVTSDVITDEVLLHTYVIKDTQKEDAFVRKTIYSDFNRGDGLRKEELSIDLNRIVEIHEISLWKNGQEVFDTFTATVEMNLPSYIDRRTCSIYRVEKDGTYTKLDTKIEGNKIIFETNHFSEYILTGVIEDLQETTPCDVHVYDEVRVEPSCTEAGSITYTCYCGDTYTETIEPTGHDFDGSKCSNCDFDKADYCSCNCHKGGIAGFFFKLILFFQKIFRTNKTCSCGVAHY